MSERELSERDEVDRTSVVRHEEELSVGARPVEYGHVRARKHVDTEMVDEIVERQAEYPEGTERVAPDENDSGEIETLEDGSVSIPVFEERLVISKEMVVRERVILRKRTVTEHERVQAELRKERVEIEASDEGLLEPERGSLQGEER